MKQEQIAAQTYTVREHTQNSRGLARTLGKLRAIGYRAVELSAVGVMDVAEIRRMLDGEGMTCCASHESEEMLFEKTPAVIERMRALNCSIAVYPWPGERRFDSLKGLREFAQKLDGVGRSLANAGIDFCYHNHHMEFARVEGRTALEVLFAETDPAFVKAELDTYWVQFGGGNPASWCRRLEGRLEVLHLKDYVVTADRQVAFAEVGQGNLDWPSIIAAADAAGCRWFAVEQDTCASDAFDSLKMSYEFVAGQLCESQA